MENDEMPYPEKGDQLFSQREDYQYDLLFDLHNRKFGPIAEGYQETRDRHRLLTIMRDTDNAGHLPLFGIQFLFLQSFFGHDVFPVRLRKRERGSWVIKDNAGHLPLFGIQFHFLQSFFGHSGFPVRLRKRERGS